MVPYIKATRSAHAKTVILFMVHVMSVRNPVFYTYLSNTKGVEADVTSVLHAMRLRFFTSCSCDLL